MLSVSNSANSTSKSGTFVTKVSNEASASFDGTNDFIDASLLGSSGNLSKTNGTISHWVKITASANNEVLFSCSDGTSGNDKVQTVFMTNTSSGQFQAVYKASGAAHKAVYNFPAVDIVNAGWFHLAMTYTIFEEALVIKLYYNGVLQNTFSGTAEPIQNSVDFDRVVLGRNANADNSYLTGFMDEVVYYSIVLSDAEIEQIYLQKGTTNFLNLSEDLSVPKLWLRMGDGEVEGTFDSTTGIVDMSNAILGSELVTDGDFSNASSFDLSIGTVTISGGTGNYPDATNSFIIQSNIVPASVKVYRLEYEIIESNNGNFRLSGGNSAFGTVALNSSVGVHSRLLTTNGSARGLQFNNQNSFIGKIDNVSLKEVQGNPAFASGALINQDDNPTA